MVAFVALARLRPVLRRDGEHPAACWSRPTRRPPSAVSARDVTAWVDALQRRDPAFDLVAFLDQAQVAVPPGPGRVERGRAGPGAGRPLRRHLPAADRAARPAPAPGGAQRHRGHGGARSGGGGSGADRGLRHPPRPASAPRRGTWTSRRRCRPRRRCSASAGWLPSPSSRSGPSSAGPGSRPGGGAPTSRALPELRSTVRRRSGRELHLLRGDRQQRELRLGAGGDHPGVRGGSGSGQGARAGGAPRGGPGALPGGAGGPGLAALLDLGRRPVAGRPGALAKVATPGLRHRAAGRRGGAAEPRSLPGLPPVRGGQRGRPEPSTSGRR